MKNYKIITDEQKLLKFIDWLPLLSSNNSECYYVALFARKKYHPSAKNTKNDKSQCKCFVATNKDWLLRKIKQLEIPLDRYTNKDGTPVHQDSLALYITINPRSFDLAQRLLLTKLAEAISQRQQNINPSSLALSCIQKAKAYTAFVDFDFDNITPEELNLSGTVNKEAYTILITKGGFHLLVNPNKVSSKYKTIWHRVLSNSVYSDSIGDNMIPIPGCTQGGFTPILEIN